MRSRRPKKVQGGGRGARGECEQQVEEGIPGDAEEWMSTDWPCKAE